MKWNRITVDAETGELGNYPLKDNNVVYLTGSEELIVGWFVNERDYENPDNSEFGFMSESDYTETEYILGWVYEKDLLASLGNTGVEVVFPSLEIDPMKKIKKYVGDCHTAYNELFDYLLLDFAWRKLHVGLNSVTRDNKNLVGFEIHEFNQGNKRQFVSTVTKEVIFEVELTLPKFEEGKDWQPTLSYIEYWKEK